MKKKIFKKNLIISTQLWQGLDKNLEFTKKKTEQNLS